MIYFTSTKSKLNNHEKIQVYSSAIFSSHLPSATHKRTAKRQKNRDEITAVFWKAEKEKPCVLKMVKSLKI